MSNYSSLSSLDDDSNNPTPRNVTVRHVVQQERWGWGMLGRMFVWVLMMVLISYFVHFTIGLIFGLFSRSTSSTRYKSIPSKLERYKWKIKQTRPSKFILDGPEEVENLPLLGFYYVCIGDCKDSEMSVEKEYYIVSTTEPELENVVEYLDFDESCEYQCDKIKKGSKCVNEKCELRERENLPPYDSLPDEILDFDENPEEMEMVDIPQLDGDDDVEEYELQE